MSRDYIAIARQYAADVINLKIPACKHTIQACQRFIDDLARQNAPDFPFYLDERAARKVCVFVEQLSFPDDDQGRRITLEPWQVFIAVNVYGWLGSSGSREGLRRFRAVYVEVPRGNGKSALVSALSLYSLCADGQAAAEVYSSAVAQKQARIIFDTSRQMALNMPARMKAFYGVEVGAHHIAANGTSIYRPLSSESKSSDGMKPSFQAIDELHAHPDRRLYEVLTTGLGKRRNSLLFVITTAGTNLASIGYAEHEKAVKILQRILIEESTFCLIYTIDTGDDWQQESTWRKANPNWETSVDPDHLRRMYNSCSEDSADQDNFQTKHLNMWLSGASHYFNMDAWQNCFDKKLKLEEFKGKQCWVGIDLAAVEDLTSVSIVFRQGEKVFVFNKCYLPDETVKKKKNASYSRWKNEGKLTVTPGAVTDYNVIKADLLEIKKTFSVHSFNFDSHLAGMLITEMIDEVGEDKVNIINQVTAVLSAPTKELHRLSLNGQLRFNSDLLMWCASNVHCTLDTSDRVKPKKDREGSPNKIDAIIATINAMVVMMETPVKPERDWSRAVVWA